MGRSGSSSARRATKDSWRWRSARSWAVVELPENAVRINEYEAGAPFRYLRFRDPPYSDKDLSRMAGEIRPLLDDGAEVYAYFRHEDEPSAPQYAERLLAILG